MKTPFHSALSMVAFAAVLTVPPISVDASSLSAPGPAAPARPVPMRLAQDQTSDLVVRLDQIENELRQLTGAVEQLQYRNQQLEQQLRHLQEDAESRFQELGSKGGARPVAPPRAPAADAAAVPPAPTVVPAPPAPGRRSDVFDPTQNPTAPGAPRTLGSVPAGAATVPPPAAAGEPPAEPSGIGAPGGRPAGAPLDLSTLASTTAGTVVPASAAGTAPAASGALPPPPPRNPNATGATQTVMAPSATPKDEYDLAYGYVLRKDYALAEEGFRAFLKKFPSDRLVPEANYWLGEALFQRQQYRDAAEYFLTVSTKFETSPKAPESLLRLGQSLAAIGEKDAACATLGELGRKFPRASVNVKQGVEREQKRVHC